VNESFCLHWIWTESNPHFWNTGTTSDVCKSSIIELTSILNPHADPDIPLDPNPYRCYYRCVESPFATPEGEPCSPVGICATPDSKPYNFCVSQYEYHRYCPDMISIIRYIDLDFGGRLMWLPEDLHCSGSSKEDPNAPKCLRYIPYQEYYEYHFLDLFLMIDYNLLDKTPPQFKSDYLFLSIMLSAIVAMGLTNFMFPLILILILSFSISFSTISMVYIISSIQHRSKMIRYEEEYENIASSLKLAQQHADYYDRAVINIRREYRFPSNPPSYLRDDSYLYKDFLCDDALKRDEFPSSFRDYCQNDTNLWTPFNLMASYAQSLVVS
jgi:hypothetical protein